MTDEHLDPYIPKPTGRSRRTLQSTAEKTTSPFMTRRGRTAVEMEGCHNREEAEKLAPLRAAV